jgi:large subunit ribosomal protein L25
VHIFGHGIESQGLQAEEKALRHVVQQAGASSLIRMQVDGKDQNVMVRKIQRHPVNGKLIHVDFYQVRMDTKTRVRLALTFVGEAPGVKILDGTLLHAVEVVNVEGLPGDLPHHLEVDVSVLEELDQALHIRDLAVPANLTVLDDPDELVVKIQPPRKVEAEAGAVEEAAPEGAAPAQAAEPTPPTAEAEPAAEGGTEASA